jgi:hypothetical protein
MRIWKANVLSTHELMELLLVACKSMTYATLWWYNYDLTFANLWPVGAQWQVQPQKWFCSSDQNSFRLLKKLTMDDGTMSLRSFDHAAFAYGWCGVQWKDGNTPSRLGQVNAIMTTSWCSSVASGIGLIKSQGTDNAWKRKGDLWCEWSPTQVHIHELYTCSVCSVCIHARWSE